MKIRDKIKQFHAMIFEIITETGEVLRYNKGDIPEAILESTFTRVQLSNEGVKIWL